MASIPMLLRRRGRRGFRRFVYLSALVGLFLLAPTAGGVPGDPTPPVITPVYSPSYPANGWFRGSVTLSWLVVDPESIILNTSGCEPKTYTTDTPGTLATCTAESDGGTNSGTVRIKLDRTPPTVSASPERSADANGWYNRPFTVSYSATDATSGVASCSPPTRYGGPDLASASVAGTCADTAGNVSSATLSFKYDATAPSLFSVTARRGNRSAQVAWRKSTDTQVVEVFRAPGRAGQGESGIYRGSATGFLDSGLTIGRAYEYRVVAIDEAANRAEHKLNFVATGPLLSPTPGARVAGPTILVWTAVRRASYYNVQLIRNGRRVLSAWPDRPSFRLRRTWLYRGRRYRLRPGVYRWYVWPGFGRISAARYTERPLGSSSFVVTR
jgi:hypothetical protein